MAYNWFTSILRTYPNVRLDKRRVYLNRTILILTKGLFVIRAILIRIKIVGNHYTRYEDYYRDLVDIKCLDMLRNIRLNPNLVTKYFNFECG